MTAAMTLHNDDDLQRGAEAVCNAKGGDPCADCLEIVEGALDAVLPAYTARVKAEALREAADAIEPNKPHIPTSDDPKRRTRIIERCTWNAAQRWLRARADVIDPQPDSENEPCTTPGCAGCDEDGQPDSEATPQQEADQ